jgi:hypothetical protein
MQAVQAAYGTDVIILNNQNQQVGKIDPLKWTDQSIHQISIVSKIHWTRRSPNYNVFYPSQQD